jgi:hypothetical protein
LLLLQVGCVVTQPTKHRRRPWTGQHLDTSRVCPCRKGPKTKTSFLGFGAKSLLAEETGIHEAPSAGEDGVLLERIELDPGLVV